MKIDPITFAVVKNGFDSIADEMAYTVVRIARSEIVKDVMDFSAALCAADGQMVAQAKTIAQHLGAIPEAMESVLSAFADDLHDGDVVIMNDPYHGGMHLPDIFMFVPIFHGGVRRAFAVVICHHTDVGGRVPGSNASDSTEIYQEGLRMPPLKLYERGVINRTLEKLIRINVRVPDRVMGDLAAQYAAAQVGRRGLEKLMERYGADELDAYMQELLDYAERMTRAEILTWPRGTWRFTDHIDNDGLSDAPIPISVAITVRGDGTLAVDYSGSSPQVRGALNSTLSFTRSLTYLSVRCVLAKDIPNNVGLFRCVDVTAPEASILNVAMPGACAARALTGYRVFDAMLGALAQIVPDKVPAAGEGGNSVICISGLRPQPRAFHHRRHDLRRVGRPARQGWPGSGDQRVAESLQHAGRGHGGRASGPHRGICFRARQLRRRSLSGRRRHPADLSHPRPRGAPADAHRPRRSSRRTACPAARPEAPRGITSKWPESVGRCPARSPPASCRTP